jgi:hypothetical protein
MSDSLVTPRSSTVEKVLALLALAYSLVLSLSIWAALIRQQELWPFPALYLLEVMILPGLAVLFAFLSSPKRCVSNVCFAGALLAFSILGAWTIGLWYVPLVLLFLAGALASWRGSHVHSVFLVAFFFLSAFFQASLMLAVVKLLL